LPKHPSRPQNSPNAHLVLPSFAGKEFLLTRRKDEVCPAVCARNRLVALSGLFLIVSSLLLERGVGLAFFARGLFLGFFFVVGSFFGGGGVDRGLIGRTMR
jgi:hypothetical protein